MIHATLTQLQYASPVKGQVLRLYVYNEDGFPSGGKWFSSNLAEEDVDMDAVSAATLEMTARFRGCETKVTDLGDKLVFHSKNGDVLYPQGMSGGDFWKSV